jgi:hypothetical protein
MGFSQSKSAQISTKPPVLRSPVQEKQILKLIRLEPTEISDSVREEQLYKAEYKIIRQATKKSTLVGNLAVSPGAKITY